MNEILTLREKRSALWEQTKNFLESRRDENGLVDAASVELYEKMTADVKALGAEIKRLEDQAAMDAQLSAATSAPVRTRPVSTKNQVSEYDKAFWAMMRGHDSIEVRNALSVGGGSPAGAEGGYTVPDEFERQLVQALDDNNIFRRIAHVIRTNSGTRTIPIAADAGSATWVEEGNSIQESDMTFSRETLSAFKLATMVKVSNELLHDSAFDLASYIAQRFGVRFGNAEEEAFVAGTGVSADPSNTPSQPTGILTTLSTAAVTSESATGVTFDDVYKLFYALKGAYRRKASFLTSETLVLQLMLLKDGRSNYIWKPGLDVGEPDTILGHPIYTSSYMPEIKGVAGQDKNKKVLLFGDFSYYWIADRQPRTLKRLNELYAVTDQVGFIGTQRVDGKLILPEAVKVLKLANA